MAQYSLPMHCPGRRLLVGLLAATALACRAAVAAGVLVRGAFGEPGSLEPRQSEVASEQAILRDLFEGLTTFGADGRIIPGAADYWTVSYAPDARTIVFELAYPSPSLPRLFAGEEGFLLPMHVISPARGDWSRAGTWVSNGAFRLVSRQVRGALRLERNVRHDASASFSLDAVDYLPSNDVAMRVNRIRAGEIHVVGWPGFPPNRQQTLRRELPPRTVRMLPLGSVRYVDARVEGWIDNPQDVHLSCHLRLRSADADCPGAG